MIEPEVAFADLAANADLAEAFLKSIFGALLDERKDDMAFFRKIRRRHVPEAAHGPHRVEVARMDLHRGDQGPRELAREVRVSGIVGHRPSERARALSDREGREGVRSR